MTDIRVGGADIEGEFVPAGSIIWGAGVKASPAHSWLGITGVAGGRIPVDDFLRVIGFDGIYSIGDTSCAGRVGWKGSARSRAGRQATRNIPGARLRSGSAGVCFKFKNRGNTPVVGRNAAVFDFGKWTLKGRAAWLLWALVHVSISSSISRSAFSLLSSGSGDTSRDKAARGLSMKRPRKPSMKISRPPSAAIRIRHRFRGARVRGKMIKHVPI